MAKIFISYAREDVEIADRIYADLVKNNHVPWMDAHDMLPGERWKDAIRRAIDDSSFFLALMSSSSINKIGYVQKELRLAVEILEEHPEDAIYMIPARVDDCNPKLGILREINWVDLFPSYADGINSILKSLERSATLSTSVIKDDPVAERYTRAISQTGDKTISAQVGGIYELEKIAQEFPDRYHWCVVEVLCTYICEGARCTPDDLKEGAGKSLTTPIQAALNVLKRRDHEKDKGKIKMPRINLVGANLNRVVLNNAVLDRTDFSKGKLFGVELNDSLLNWTRFRGTVLEEASLQGASLYDADFSTAVLRRANLCGAYFTGTNLSHSLLHGADLSTANNLTQNQINSAYGDKSTKLPDGLERPKRWLESRSENEIPLGYALKLMQRR